MDQAPASLASVGIDLGTTNCAVSTAGPRHDGIAAISDFPVPQVTHPGVVESLPTLPSFLYLPGEHELPAGALSLPWDAQAAAAVGAFAREQGARVPHRLVSSAKSWLCSESVDRRGAILPWKAPDEVPRCSPVEASASYLRHLQAAFDAAHPDSPLASLDLVLTVPASFDVVARELTVESARLCGLSRLTLLEEPQAALYAWLARAGEGWRKQISVGDCILVCDIGGGTSDFSLIAVEEEDGSLQLRRLAVGDHLLLGGDNMDLALAAAVQSRLKSRGTRLDAWQHQVLTHACRGAKEKLLSDPEVQVVPLVVPGRGSGLIGGAIREELLRTDVEAVLLGGFFPHCERTDFAQRQRRLGLAEVGLAYESDAAITRHLAAFLGARGDTAPTAVLFNGGVLGSPLLRDRILEVLNGWLESMQRSPLRVLHNESLDLAVARGAAQYGLVKQGGGLRIRGGIARAYYIGVEVPRPAIPGLQPPVNAVCVAANGMEEGTSVELEGQEFALRVGQTVEFKFMAAAHREDDRPGEVLADWEPDDSLGIEEIASLSLDLQDAGRLGESIPVTLRTQLTELGTLELWCDEKGGAGRWKLELEVREAGG